MKYTTALIAAVLAAAGATSAKAQSSGDFYKGKTIRVMVGFNPGGSYDFYARLAAEMLKAHIPGLEAAIVENRPGAGGLVATNYFYNQAPKDGLALAVLPDTIANTQLMEPTNSKWDVTKINYIGSFAPVNSAVLRRGAAPAKSIQDMKKIEVIVGCSGKNAQSYQFPAMLKAFGGYQFKMICGYPGAKEYSIALERGEIDMVSSAWATWRVTHRAQMEKGEMVPVFQIGLKRDPELKDTPLMQELVEDPKAKQAIEFVSGGTAIGRALSAPPGLPADRVAFLRATFDRMTSDPAMIEQAKKRNLQLNPTPGVEIQTISARIVATPKEIIDLAAKAFQ